MPAFIILFLCFLVFTTEVGAKVTIEKDTTTYNVAVGDTLSITARRLLAVGENFIKWEVVSGTGQFTDATADSSGFIPTSSDAVIRMVTQTLPTYEISENLQALSFYKSSTKIPRLSQYGIRMNYKATEDGQFAFVYKSGQGLTPMYFAGDSTFTTSAATSVFSANTSCTFTTTREVKCVFKATANTNNYFCAVLAYYPNHDMKDSAYFGITRTHTVTVTHSGQGAAYIDSLNLKALSYSKIISLDSTKIYAIPDTNYVFDHWEVTSGTCSIRDTKKDTSLVYDVKSDCKINAIFTPGSIYTITSTPTQYNFTENSYAKKISSGHAGVRFTFTAPSSGSYTFITSTDISSDSIFYLRYTNSTYSTLAQNKKFNGTVSDKLTLTAGQVVSIVISNSSNKNDNPFYINYASQAYKILLSTDGNGTTTPVAGYDTAYAGSKYSISAEANTGYRFSNWQTISGTPTLDDAKAPYTYITINSATELKATFKPSTIHSLTKTKQSFNYQDNYYNESTLSAIRFTWTPPDTNTYVINFEQINPIGGIFKSYGTDKTFTTVESEKAASGSTGFTFKGTPGTPLYWTLQDSSSNIPNKSFNAWISTPYILNVKTSDQGSVNPFGKVYMTPGEKIILTAWPYGGYVFKSWINTEGDLTITEPGESRTAVYQKDSLCTIKATYTVDPAADPLLKIMNIDLSNYPQICTQVSVTDNQNGHSFYGMVPDDFVMTEDGNRIYPQVTSINNISGVSVVIVVDESSSMTINNRMTKAKDAIRKFVENMGPYDRTSIVGFRGYDSTTVHQTMTSDKYSLMKAIDSISAVADMTNIITGTIAGLNQIVNETNPTAVIVFSDGDSNSGSRDVRGTVELAKDKRTTIYSIALESETKYPLENLAVGSGGTFSIASDADELAGLYAAIRDNIMSQYLVCYQTSDTIQNGETHNVVISTKFNKKTTVDSTKWSENATPPVITLTDETWNLINTPQNSTDVIKIGAYITAPLSIKSAELHIRTSSTTNAPFQQYNLQHVSGNLWEFTVPTSIAQAPGVDFYIIVEDSLGQLGKSPKIPTPSREPYTIFIDNDIPSVTEISAACEDSTKDTKTFRYKIKDNDGIYNATLFYKESRAIIYQEITLIYSAQDGLWVGSIPASTNDYESVNYYVRVTDTKGATIRDPKNGYSTTDACRVKVPQQPEDSSKTDPTPVDTTTPSPRDSIVYSLIADTAEIYDKDLDGKADFVRIHFKEERDDNITSIDSIFWNSNRGEWRYAPTEKIKKSREDRSWIEAYINKPFNYGLTKADTVHKPFLSFTTAQSDKLENVVLNDKVGAVPAKATKAPGKIGLEEYMNPGATNPPDTLIIRMSEPIKNIGKEKAWKELFRYSSSCKDTVSQPIPLKEDPIIRENGQVWTLILDGYSIKTGFCLFSNPSATYEDLVGNSLGRGGVEIEGKDGMFYLGTVKPLQPVSGIGKTPKWIPPGSSDWETLPDTISAISVKTMSPYTAEIYIFDGIATYVTHFKQKFGNNGEMDDPARGNSSDPTKLGFLYWDQRAENGRRAGTGIYIWKIIFKFEDGHKETRTIKTGIYRRGDKKKKKK
ncbi:MAG: VWA domain-containing protein [Fibrobacter sp.]|nr:VWA domain-containing protein [Fibrobacter sp.]